MPITTSKKIIILGITRQGQIFRPTDWPERMCGLLSTFNNHRINYSPLLQPIVNHGLKAVELDCSLKYIDPTLYQSILKFIEENDLKTLPT